jgi:hypothetical protein
VVNLFLRVATLSSDRAICHGSELGHSSRANRTDKGLSGNVIGHVLLRRAELSVVRAARSGMNEATSDARDEDVVRDQKLDRLVQ